ncbi:N-acetylmuramoyl-L-alanine amidase family protein, partial [Ligilactobacillus animalis]|uniref:N-acetylmuramoyl-L-alanine amidase family protein n=1 Tax=Ligilactobacillus animalis TaxID=1605 RepID=UPI0026DF21CD
MDNFEVKKHYKMYKAGKNWVVAPLITVGVVTGIAMGTSLSMADEVSVNNENANVVQSEKSLNFDNNSISNEDETLKNNDDNDNKEVEKTDETKDVNNDENITNETVAQNDTSAERAVIDNVTDKVTGEQKIDDHWYLFNDRGEMQQGLQDLRPYGSEKHAYYNEAGQMQYGWQRVNNEAHYFDTYDGAMAVGEKKINDHWYLFDKDGNMQRGIQDLRPYGSEKHAYYNEDGWMQYGWQRVNNEAHYFDTYDGAMAVGEKKINDHWYLFDKDGNMQRGIQDLR